ncbi:MAG: ABC transporter ATP-binding protein [Rhodospirillales bacterium]|nr:ABC transporter ATP-binding protein [Rhodospirillales bacterium]
MEEIVLTNVSKSYGKELAVKNLNLRVKPGEFLTVLGPSGCGKTTTLRLIAGLEEPDSGEIFLGGTLVFSREKGILVPPENRNLGLIFQSYALWPHMTVGRNITLALEQKKLTKDQIEKRLTAALERVQLKPYQERFPSELSGGQQQRVAVARLIAMQPSFLMMDEPLSNLDAMLRTDMRGELKRLHRDLEATTVYVTHDQIEALTLSDTVVVMDKGVVQQEAAAYDIYHRPANLFVAEFIGNPRINRLDGILRRLNGVQVIDFGELTVPIEMELPVRDGPVVTTIRPENVRLSTDQKDDWLKVNLDSVLPTGSETILQTSCGETHITVVESGFFRMAADRPLWLSLEATSMNFFDPDTGRNLLI